MVLLTMPAMDGSLALYMRAVTAPILRPHRPRVDTLPESRRYLTATWAYSRGVCAVHKNMPCLTAHTRLLGTGVLGCWYVRRSSGKSSNR
jgi:hypothetical protein